MRLIADVGGTNTRLALASGGTVQAETQRTFRNDDFDGFEVVAARYLAEIGAGGVDEMVIAVAGPVTGRAARLTNRDWHFDSGVLTARFAAATRLINDLTALGHAVPLLSGDGLAPLCPAPQGHQGNGQALVVGIGTGFNVSPVLRSAAGTLCPAAEMGHVSLPGRVRDAILRRLGSFPDDVQTVEHCFSGRGVSRMNAAFTGRDGVPPEDIMAGDDPETRAFTGFYAGLIGALAADLLLAFMPCDGIHFAGSVARAALGGPGAARFCESFREPSGLAAPIAAPAFLILDDAAALRGCAGARIG